MYSDDVPLETDAAYSFSSGSGTSGTCKNIINGSYSAMSFQYVQQNNSDQLISALRLGPVAVAIDGSSFAFMFYTNGILNTNSNCGTTLNHAVLLVGYNKDSNPPSYRILNSYR
jgi:C1A family cysteine protease